MPNRLTPETITIIGASARAAAQSALRAGFAVVAADLFADRDLARLCPTTRNTDYPAEFAATLAADHPGGWIYTGGLENYPELIDAWSRRRPLFGADANVLRNVRHPQRVAEALRAAGLSAPAVAFSPTHLSRDRIWLQKPLRSSGGNGIRICTPESDALRTTPANTYYQELINGEACSAVYVACGGAARLLGVSRQLVGVDWLGCDGFRYAGSIGPRPLTASRRAAFQLLGDTLAKNFALAGLFGVDAILHDDEVWTIEVNPRYPASAEALERAGSFSAVRLHIAACRGGQLPRETSAVKLPTSGRVSGKAILFARESAVIPASLSDEWLTEALAQAPCMADVPTAGTVTPAGGPIVTLLADGASEEEVLDRLRALAAAARSRLEALGLRPGIGS